MWYLQINKFVNIKFLIADQYPILKADITLISRFLPSNYSKRLI